MWNVEGIEFCIGYAIFAIIFLGLSFSCGLDCGRAENSKGENRIDFYKKAFGKALAITVAVLGLVNFGSEVADRNKAHKYDISDKMCVEISAESGWSESNVRDYLTITAKNGGSVEDAAAYIKGEK